MPVIDASVVVAYLGEGEQADRADNRIEAEQGRLFAPHLIDAEVGHALRRMVATKRRSEGEAAQALADLADLPLQRTGHVMLLDTAWSFRSSVSFYDALYLALAMELEVDLLTLDARLARAAKDVSVKVEVI